MRKLGTVGVAVTLAVALISGTAFGQFGVGLKLPSSEAFVATTFSDGFLIEGGVPILGLINGVLTIVVDGKLMFAPLSLGDVPLIPFMGAGMGLTPLGDTLIISPHGLAGLEYRLPEPPLAFFAEVGAGIAFTPLGVSLSFGGQIGARLGF